MLWHRRKHFDRIVERLRGLARNSDDLNALLECEQLLLKEILLAEDRIRKAKEDQIEIRNALRNGRLAKAEANKLRARLDRSRNRVEAYQQTLYIWRCFGDGIAFTYLDKHAVKQAFYNTRDLQPKEHAGFISGKDGLSAEIKIVEEAIASGLPTILTDLTNSIRHGDVCILTGADPYFVEVKSGGRLNKRGRRQAESIEKLHRFFETDLSTELRGLPEIRRVAVESLEVSYVEEMNRCIREAQQGGARVVNPEAGLYYVAIYDDKASMADLFSKMNLSRALVFTLNSAKSDRTWSPYLPFTLTIDNASHLYDFVCGELYLMVLVDIELLCGAIRRPGIEVWWVEGDDYPLKYRHAASGNSGGLSQHFINRIGFEFASPRWVANTQQRILDKFETNAQQ